MGLEFNRTILQMPHRGEWLDWWRGMPLLLLEGDPLSPKEAKSLCPSPPLWKAADESERLLLRDELVPELSDTCFRDLENKPRGLWKLFSTLSLLAWLLGTFSNGFSQ